MNSTQALRSYFSYNLSWGWDEQAQAVFHFLLAAKNHASQGVVLDAGAGFQRYKPFFSDSLYIALEHPESGAINKNIASYDILADSSLIPLLDYP